MSDWLSELIEDAVDDVANTVDSTIHAIDEAVKQAARTLLDATFPPMVRTQYLAIKSANWLAVEGAAAAVTATLAGAQAGMVFSGAVEKKVQAGLDHIASKNDYAHAVNSITP